MPVGRIRVDLRDDTNGDVRWDAVYDLKGWQGAGRVDATDRRWKSVLPARLVSSTIGFPGTQVPPAGAQLELRAFASD